MLFFEDFASGIIVKIIKASSKDISLGLLAELRDADLEKRRRAFKVLWALSIVVMIVITAVFVGGFYAVENPKPGLIVATILWAVFFGVTGLMFLSTKAICTVFGVLLGTSISELGSASGLISAINRAVLQITGEITTVMGDPASVEQSPFISMLVWIFVLIVTILCLPAFFIKDKSEKQKEINPHNPVGAQKSHT